MQANGHNISRCLDKRQIYENQSPFTITIFPELQGYTHLMYVIDLGQMREQPWLAQNHVFIPQVRSCHKEIVREFNPSDLYRDIPANSLQPHSVTANSFQGP